MSNLSKKNKKHIETSILLQSYKLKILVIPTGNVFDLIHSNQNKIFLLCRSSELSDSPPSLLLVEVAICHFCSLLQSLFKTKIVVSWSTYLFMSWSQISDIYCKILHDSIIYQWILCICWITRFGRKNNKKIQIAAVIVVSLI